MILKDYVHRAADKQRTKSMGMGSAEMVLLAYGILLGVSAFTFVLAVIESAQ